MPAWIRFLVLSSIVMACGSKKRVEPPAPAPLASTSQSPGNQDSQSGGMALDGKGLYANLCASCHGVLEQSSAARANVASIQTALLDIPEMQDLPELKDEQVEALANVLSKIPPGKGRNKP